MAAEDRNIHLLASEVNAYQIGKRPFPEAAEAWLESRKSYISPKTFHEYKLNIKTLAKFFGDTKPETLTAESIWKYQQARKEQRCGPSGINHECSVLQQMLKRIGNWQSIADHYQALPLPREQRGRVLSLVERQRLMANAQNNPAWEASYLFALISINTTTGPKETATLRLKDIDLERNLLIVPPEGAKNVHRIRPIPLNEEALDGVKIAIARAKRLGAFSSEHYLFPFRIHRSLFDPTRHQMSFKGSWLKMVAAADLRGLRMYDLRHHAVTELLENPAASQETVLAIAGHISRQMQRHYSHVRIEAMRDAVNAMNRPAAPTPTDYLSNNAVLEMVEAGLPPEIIAAKIKASKCSFDTSVETLKKYRIAGVHNSVILAMVRA